MFLDLIFTALSLLLATTAATAGSTKHIVVLEPGITASQRIAHLKSVPHFDAFDFGSDLNGYTTDSILDVDKFFLQHKDIVNYVEKDIPMRLKSQAQASPSCKAQTDVPSWGLARTSAVTYPLKNYQYPSTNGNADVYVLDTGIRVTHKEFQGRASFAFNAAKGKVNTDTDGHGTFVAGVLAAEHYGVCKSCNIISVKIFTDDGDCSASVIIAGLNYVMQQVKSGNSTKRGGKKILINISVGGDPGQTSDVMDAAVNALVGLGVHVVTAAGNENVDACTESPARAKDVIAVGSSMILLGNTDYFLGGSNFGKCVKLFAPGDKIVSLGIGSDTEVGITDSGTSFSSPHVAGVLAELSMLYPNSTLPEIQSMMFNSTLKGVIGGVPKETANKLLHHGCNTGSRSSPSSSSSSSSLPPAPDKCLLKHRDEVTCDADKTTDGSGCTWCKQLGAEPSTCWTIANSKKFPAGVYACDKQKNQVEQQQQQQQEGEISSSFMFQKLKSRSRNSGWKVQSRSAPDKRLTLHVFIRHTKKAKEALQGHLEKSSYPSSPDYGQHLSFQELNQLMKPDQASISAVRAWLKRNKISDVAIRTNPSGDILEIDTTVRAAEQLLNTNYYVLLSEGGSRTIHRSTDIQLPMDVAQHVDIVGPTTHVPHVTSLLKSDKSDKADKSDKSDKAPKLASFTTPPSLRAMYGIDTSSLSSLSKSSSNSTLGIVGFLNQFFDPQDISYFWKHVSVLFLLACFLFFIFFICATTKVLFAFCAHCCYH